MALWIWSGERVAPVSLEGIQVSKCLICGEESGAFFYSWSTVGEDDVDSITMGLCGGPECLVAAHKWVKSGQQPLNPVSGTRSISNWRGLLASWRETRSISASNQRVIRA